MLLIASMCVLLKKYGGKFKFHLHNYLDHPSVKLSKYDAFPCNMHISSYNLVFIIFDYAQEVHKVIKQVVLHNIR